MSAIKFRQKGDFKKLTGFLATIQDGLNISILDKYGRRGVEALRAATPKESGKTASSWEYRTKHTKGKATIEWINTNTNDGVNIAIILQYGHGTGNGGYVKGKDYINPVMQPLFDQLAEEAWKEVTKV